MKITLSLLALLPLFGSLLSCSDSHVTRIYHDRDSEMGRAIAQMDLAEKDYYVRADREKYLATARNFVHAAQKNDPKSMLAMTSPLTIKATGRKKINTVYESNMIPGFKGTQVKWNAPSEIITDDTGNRGYVISGKVTGARSFPVYVTVMKERGQYRVTTLNVKR